MYNVNKNTDGSHFFPHCEAPAIGLAWKALTLHIKISNAFNKDRIYVVQ